MCTVTGLQVTREYMEDGKGQAPPCEAAGEVPPQPGWEMQPPAPCQAGAGGLR